MLLCNLWVSFGDLSICHWLTVKYNLICYGQKKCIVSEISRTPITADNPNPNPPVLEIAATQVTGITF